MPLPANPRSIEEIEQLTPGATVLIQAMRAMREDGIPKAVVYQDPHRARAAEYLVALGLAETSEDPLIGGTRYKINEATLQALQARN